MKKLLNLTLLAVITISFLNATKTNLNFHIQKREITSPPNVVSSLQEMITTINIGQIESNTQEHIIQGLQNLQPAQNLNPTVRELLLRENTNNNLEFENIAFNTARVHLISGQWRSNTFIPATITFTINFTTNHPVLSDIITNTNLGYIVDNSNFAILQALQNAYPLIIQLNLHLVVSNTTINTARISYYSNRNYLTSRNNYVDINFQTNVPRLNTMNLTTDLGELQNNSSETILAAFRNANINPLLPQNINVGQITNNSAIIHVYGVVYLETWIINENGQIFRPVTLEEEQRINETNIEEPNSIRGYFFPNDIIRVTFTLQNSNQNETQIARPDINYSDNDRFSTCSNINLNHQNIEKRNIENFNPKQLCITAIKTLTKNTVGGNLKPGNTYFGTNNGVFLKINNILYKFHGLNFPIFDIKLDKHGSAYIVNDKKEIYHLNLYGWDATKIQNAESNNLTKEIKLFYNKHKENLIIENNWWNNPWNYKIVHDFNLGKINPFDYQKVEFLGDDKDFYSKISWGNTAYYGKKLNEFSSKNLKDYLTKCHVVVSDDGVSEEECPEGRWKEFEIQDINQSYFLAHIHGYQEYFLTWYKENDNYHLQVIVEQDVTTTGSLSGGSIWLNLGKGIRLYND